MPRSRSIKPGFFKNEELADLPPEARLLFVGTWMLADREGRLEDRPKKIRAEIFPYDRVDCERHLQSLHDAGFILRYVVDGKPYIQVVNWHRHQNPHHMESPSEIPPPPGIENRFNHTPISPKTRRKILDRDGHKCVICGSLDNLQLDHIIPITEGGTSDENNLRTLCAQCNLKKRSKHRPNENGSSTPGLIVLTPDSGLLTPDSGLPEVGGLHTPNTPPPHKRPLAAAVKSVLEEFEPATPPPPLPQNGDVKHTRNALAGEIGHVPDERIVGRVMQAAQEADPKITDAEVALWVHAVTPDGSNGKPRGPAWWAHVVAAHIRERPRDVTLLRAFVRGELPTSEADAILAEGRAHPRLLKALRAWRFDNASELASE